MAYAISYKAPTGKTFKAVIKDLETNLFWDNLASVWQADNDADCKVTLTESGTYKGVYTGSAGATPGNGGIYQILVYDSNDSNFLATTDEVYPPKTETALEVINAVQTELRMPLSSAINDSLAKIILAKMNTVLTVLLPQNNVFDHLKVKGTFTLKTNVSFYRVSPVNVDTVDRVDYLAYNDAATDILVSLDKLTDGDFRESADSYSKAGTTGAPAVFRNAQRDYGLPFVEIAPAPNKTYTITYEAVKAPKKLTLAAEYVPIPLVIKNGALMLMKQDQGRDAAVEAGIFSAATDRAAAVEANSSFGDVKV